MYLVYTMKRGDYLWLCSNMNMILQYSLVKRL